MADCSIQLRLASWAETAVVGASSEVEEVHSDPLDNSLDENMIVALVLERRVGMERVRYSLNSENLVMASEGLDWRNRNWESPRLQLCNCDHIYSSTAKQ